MISRIHEVRFEQWSVTNGKYVFFRRKMSEMETEP